MGTPPPYNPEDHVPNSPMHRNVFETEDGRKIRHMMMYLREKAEKMEQDNWMYEKIYQI